MPVSFFDTLPLELQERFRLAERQRQEVEAQRKARDARTPDELAALDSDWIGIGSTLGSAAEEARRLVLTQSPFTEVAQVTADPAAIRAEVIAQHKQTHTVAETRREKDLKHFEPREEPHCRVLVAAVVARATPAELDALVRKRLERLGASVPKHLRPSTRREERELHKLVHFCRGNELVDKEDYRAAIADYNVSLSMLPNDPFALINRGNCHKALRSWAAAMADYSAAIAAAMPPSSKRMQLLLAYAHNNLGTVHHDIADYVSAFAEYTSALAFNPGCHITWKNRANIYNLTVEPSPDPLKPPPQHKFIFSDCLTSMDQDWHEEKGFSRGVVDYAVEVRKIHRTYAAYMVVDLVRLPFRREPPL